jgi:hypothetical protein
MQKIAEKGLTLNKEKCQFRMTRLHFMGRVLTQKGGQVQEDKIKAVKEARRPENAPEVRSFLGLVNFNARFINNMASISEPPRRLIRKNAPSKLGNEEENSFQSLKQALVQ